MCSVAVAGFLLSVAGFVLFMLLPGAEAENSREITVSAAASVRNAFEEIGRLYEMNHTGTRVLFNFGASGDLMRQIEGGAPVDVFASAAEKDMDDAEMKGLILSGSRIDFAANTVVLVAPAASGTPIKSFGDLTTDRVKKIAVGNPKTVPAGRYAEEVFRSFKIENALRDKLVFTGNVRQALDYVARGEVDAGVVYATDAMTVPKEVRIVATAPGQSHRPAVYPIAVVKGTKNGAAAKDFVMLVLSPGGQKILAKYGFKKR